MSTVVNPAAETGILPESSNFGGELASVEAAAAAEAARSLTLSQRAATYIELTKPGIVRMVLITAGTGFFLASALGHPLDVVLMLNALLGIGLAASGACGLNEYVEWEADTLMRRTLGRPVPSTRMTPRAALYFSSVLVLLGLLHLQLFVDSVTAALVALTVVTYVFIYTPLKRRSWLATLVGAVPGALPILAGWTAGGGGMTAPGFALFTILFLWQMPHFYALAWIYREDYRRGGFRMLTSFDPSGIRTGRQIVFFGVLLLLVSMLPTRLGLTGGLYLTAALILGVLFLALGVAMAMRRDDRRAMRLFLGSVVYLPLLLITMVIDRLVG